MFFSLGGIGGAAAMPFMIYLGVTPLLACYVMSFLLVILFSISYFGLVRSGEKENKKYFSLPKGIIIHVCLLCFLMGVIEGSIIDWGAFFITTELGMPRSVSGLGYVTFTFAMILGRFFGDKLVTLYGRNKVFFISSISIGLGFLLVINFGVLFITLIGFICIGLGASNMVPILCSTSGRQSIMAPSHAVAAIVTFGYAGIMIGPVLIGFIAHLSGLTLAFFILALSTMFLMLSARIIR